ncbi:hypothetical protein J4218_04690 [Candidatus Pacearchaeota archaeon]|nr:hypothetical protein [Candidatus Pacearchaeota archaeon]
MIPATADDRLRLKIYRQLEKSSSQLNPSDFALVFRQTYEKEKYAKHWFSNSGEKSLEDELLNFAYTYLNSPENKKRHIDANALKVIKKRNKCKGTDSIAISYFRVYNDMKKGLTELMNGIAYIEDQVESDGMENLDFEDNTLEGKLIKLALTCKRVPESKKRKIDYQALDLIMRCSSCKNSPALVRYYYGFYKGQIEE